MEVVIADGMSNDGSREIINSFATEYPDLPILLIDNPHRQIPSALNQAIAAAGGDIVVRLDAHSVPEKDYIKRCVQVLEVTGAANVGGAWVIQPGNDGLIARGIAAAAAHPLGAGDARYRIGGNAGEVETVPFGAYRREWIERVGLFNEDLLTNEDYEYNVRLRGAGGLVWFDPSIRITYFARPTLISLAKQYWRYGYWKARMLMQYPETLRWRQAIPLLFVLTLILLAFLSIIFPLTKRLLSFLLGAYLLTTVVFGTIQGFKQRDFGVALGFPVSLWIMHFTWGLGFLASSIHSRFSKG